MNQRLRLVLVLVAIWGITFGIIKLARAAKPTAQSVAAYVQKANINSMTAADRQKTIMRIEEMMNRISYEDRQKLRRDRVTDRFFRSLTPEEQTGFLDATLPTGFKQMMESFNKMDPVKRKEFVDRALAEMRKHEGEEPPPSINDKNVQKIVDNGLRSFYSDANADVKLDLTPLVEQMQKNLQGPR